MVLLLPQAFHDVRSIEVPAKPRKVNKNEKQCKKMRKMLKITRTTHIEYLIASTAASAGKKSSTATDLFSFFLSVFMENVRDVKQDDDFISSFWKRS